MKFDLSQFDVKQGALSPRPFEILAGAEKKFVSALLEMMLLEGAARTVRDAWQMTQLGNLMKHAQARSSFWKSRLSLISGDPRHLARLPALTRQELGQQVQREGSLIRPEDGLKDKKHSTSGSSGTPVQFFITQANANYNVSRYLMESLANGRIHLSRCHFSSDYALAEPGFTLTRKQGGDLSKRRLLKEADVYEVKYGHFDPSRLLETVAKCGVAVWTSNPAFMETMLSRLSPAQLHGAGLRQWVSYGSGMPSHVRRELSAAGIAVSSSYSSEEVGPIGFECRQHPENYHVVSSNVVLHPSKERYVHEGVSRHRILVTHLHSYATPIIRYDLGDLGQVVDGCPCGFDGQVVTGLAGKVSSLLRHADGSASTFVVLARKIFEIGRVREYRARQVSFTKVVVDVVPEGDGSAILEPLRSYLSSVAGPGIEVDIQFRNEIDWGSSAKRPYFRSEIA